MNIKRIFNFISYAILLFLAIFLFSIIKDLSELAELAYAGSGRFVFFILLAFIISGFIYLLYPLIFRKDKIILKSNYSEQEKNALHKLLTARLSYNPILKNSDFLNYTNNINKLATNNSPLEQHIQSEFITIYNQNISLELCYQKLDEEAKKEIMSLAKKVFVGTALSQNGRLDAIIVFFALCRTIWVTARIYNHNPHPLELLSLYRNVAYSTFLAFSFEELDLGAEISGSLLDLGRAISPALGAAQIPFVGNALKKLTSSCIDGAANSFLLIRVGLITRNLYKYHLMQEEMPSRRAVFAESGSLLKELSNETVQTIINKVKSSIFKGHKQPTDSQQTSFNQEKIEEQEQPKQNKKLILQQIIVLPKTIIKTATKHTKKNFQIAGQSSLKLIKSSSNSFKKLSNKIRNKK